MSFQLRYEQNLVATTFSASFASLLAGLSSGHNIRATVVEECGSIYRAEGPEEFRSLGKTEFVTGIAAMSANGGFGPARACVAIVGNVDLMLGSRVGPILEAHAASSRVAISKELFGRHLEFSSATACVKQRP